MKFAKLLFILILLFSCQKQKDELKVKSSPAEKKVEEIGYVPFTKELSAIILDYQKKNTGYNKKIKEYSGYDKKKIYEVVFRKQGRDTVVGITLQMDGINTYYDRRTDDVRINGIYSSKNFQSTYIKDPLHIGKKFIMNYKTDGIQLEKYKMDDDNNDLFFDTYLYKVKSNKFVLDTILEGSARYLWK